MLSNLQHVVELVISNLNELEKKIVDLLVKNGGAMYQSDIAKALGIPKSTLSITLAKLGVKV